MKEIELILIRKIYTDKSTIGDLFINNEFFCNTLEDKVRDINKDGDLDDKGEQKVYAQTAIPSGRYQVIINKSRRFKVDMPLLIGVKGFEGIRIHPGNHKDNTEGCILLGQYDKNKPDWISNSRIYYNGFMNKLRLLLLKNKVFIKILDNEILG
jgi:hypothetical protein